MAESIEIRFPSKGDVRTANVPVDGTVKAVLILPVAKDAQEVKRNEKMKADFAKAQGITLHPGFAIPPEVTDAATGESFQLDSSEPGPGVCYWVGDQLVCW